jgi:hypothetical protein
LIKPAASCAPAYEAAAAFAGAEPLDDDEEEDEDDEELSVLVLEEALDSAELFLVPLPCCRLSVR